ncbi:ATP-dependent RNA helicase DDX24 [Leptopilina heterotoma]|uniref:ATP-dependent RNA helicase DDX24 n=1 Tax=Leptopilina heterotoma TaxID=63436 RepID=UPI001CA909C1|nr:ATP-dependent RNA helicase DDX24 [Leptopilina heterotoma]XP_043484895.1 ATP-dependent RNA helicase DDX24 [Leptopilina heterotoma]
MVFPRRKKNNSSGWKSVDLEGTVLNSEIGGLIGIEELTSYKIEGGKIVPTEINDKKSNKRSRNEDEKRQVKKRKESHSKSRKKSQKSKKGDKIKSDVNIVDENENNDEIDSNFNSEAWISLGVTDVILKSLKEQNFDAPTQIQSLTLAPAILGRRDILGAAETGSGKTLAFGIPIIHGILELKKRETGKFVVSKSGKFEETENLENENCCNSDNEEDSSVDSENETSEDEISENENSEDENSENENSENESSENSENENFDREKEIGCVKVIDNIEIKSSSVNSSRKPFYALILTPTRELAIQIKNHLTKAAKYTDIQIAVILGGMAAVKQERILKRGPEIVIATPGRFWELVSEGNPHLNQLDSIKFLAIDETDRMLEKGHFQELHSIIERINMDEKKVKERQNFVFSATLTMVHDLPDYLRMKKKRNSRSKIFKLTPGQKLQRVIEMLKVKNPKVVDLTKERGTAGSLTESRIACTIDYKDYYLYYFLKRHEGRTLVFCNSIGCVKRLATLFGILDLNPLPLHANMVQKQRLKNLERFQANENGFLIATDVAARGLDIPNVEHVIHYQVPRTSESYVHRSGRTARAQKEGITVLLMEPSEKDMYTKICKTLNREHDIPTFPVVERLLQAVKERVDIAREIDKLELNSRRNNLQKDWIRKAAEDMDMIIEDAREYSTTENEEIANTKRALKVKRNQLMNLLSKPLFPKGFSGKYPDINLHHEFNEKPQKAIELMKSTIVECPMKKKSKIVAKTMSAKKSKFKKQPLK